MRIINTFVLLFSTLCIKADSWTQKANFPGGGRELPYSFSIGNFGYVGGGTGNHDLYEYDPATNTWTSKTSIPNSSDRRASIGFSINDKGYVGLGHGPSTYHQDLWEYDPLLDSWTQKANFGGGGRFFANVFVIEDKAYVGCGSDGSNHFNDLWEWDQNTNVWTTKSNLPGEARAGGVAFSLNGKGYITTGTLFPSWQNNLNDLWEFDPITNSWSQKNDLPAIKRVDAVGFSICQKGFICTGGETKMNDLWQYNPFTDSWIQKTNFAGVNRDDATAFVINNIAYLGLGQDNNETDLSDFWEYTPDYVCETGIVNDNPNTNLKFSISPNPATNFIIIEYDLSGNKNKYSTIIDIHGKVVSQNQLPYGINRLSISLKDFSEGIYFVKIGNEVKRFVKE